MIVYSRKSQGPVFQIMRFVNNGFGMELQDPKFNTIQGEDDIIVQSTKSYLRGSLRT